MEYCAGCGKCMTDDNGSSTIGIAITVCCESGQNKEFMQKQIGKYDLGKSYGFCWECCLDSLMV